MGSDAPSRVPGRVDRIAEEQIRNHLGESVRESVEDALNAMLDREADQLCKDKRDERRPDRASTGAVSYRRDLDAKTGKVTLKRRRLRSAPFEMAIIERYCRRLSSVEETLMELYLAGVSVRRVEDISAVLWGTRVSPSTVSELNQQLYKKIDAWRDRPLTGFYPYVFLDAVALKRSSSGEVRNVSVLVAIAVADDGFREVIGAYEGATEDKESWGGFLRQLKERGLVGVQLVISDEGLGLVEAVAETYPRARWQRCVVSFYRTIFSLVSEGKVERVGAMLKAIHAQEDRTEAVAKAKGVRQKLIQMKLEKAAELLEEGIEETLSYYAFPREHWRHVKTNNPLERILLEFRRRTRAVGVFPDGHSALMLVSARLRHVAGTKWSAKKYLDTSLLSALDDSQLKSSR